MRYKESNGLHVFLPFQAYSICVGVSVWVLISQIEKTDLVGERQEIFKEQQHLRSGRIVLERRNRLSHLREPRWIPGVITNLD